MHHSHLRFNIVMKQTQLSYDICSHHARNWQALGSGYTTIRRDDGKPCIAFVWFDWPTQSTGATIVVNGVAQRIVVEFPPKGRYTNCSSYDLNFVPVWPFKNCERVKVWSEFFKAMQMPTSIERLDEIYNYDD
jgi:hypothetical protein